MSGIKTRLGRRTTTAVACSALALVSATGTAFAAAPVENAPPVVNLVLDGDKVKVKGADDLDAGWVTIKASSTSLARSLWLFTPKTGTSPEQARKATEAMRAVRGNDGQTASAAAEGTAQKRTAANAKTVESSLVALGGAFVAPGRPATFSVNLPEGEVSIGDLAAPAQDATKPIASLMLGDPGTAVRSAGQGAPVSVDKSGRISSADSLPRAGKVRISNLSEARWHFLSMRKLNDGAGQQDVVAFYGGSGRSPFVAESEAASAPLAGGHSEYLDYDLPAGRYAIVDEWVNSKTGRFYSSQGAIKVVDLK